MQIHLFWSVTSDPLVLCALLGAGYWLVGHGPKPNPETAKLFASLKNKDMPAVTKAIQQGADVNARDEFGFTPLMRAVMDQTPAAVPVLLGNGADLNARTSPSNETPLMIAIKFKQRDTASLFLKRKADISVRSIDGQTAQTLAQRYRLIEIATKIEGQEAAK